MRKEKEEEEEEGSGRRRRRRSRPIRKRMEDIVRNCYRNEERFLARGSFLSGANVLYRVLSSSVMNSG